jgi:hypothetical protein
VLSKRFFKTIRAKTSFNRFRNSQTPSTSGAFSIVKDFDLFRQIVVAGDRVLQPVKGLEARSGLTDFAFLGQGELLTKDTTCIKVICIIVAAV